MKKLILTFAVGMVLSAAPAFAYESHHEEQRVAYSDRGRNSLDRHVNHLNRMLQHVRGQARQYRADWRVRRDIDQISRETDRLNRRFRSGDYNRSRLRAEVDRLHDRLHAIEDRMHIRSRDIYRWD